MGGDQPQFLFLSPNLPFFLKDSFPLPEDENSEAEYKSRYIFPGNSHKTATFPLNHIEGEACEAVLTKVFSCKDKNLMLNCLGVNIFKQK